MITFNPSNPLSAVNRLEFSARIGKNIEIKDIEIKDIEIVVPSSDGKSLYDDFLVKAL